MERVIDVSHHNGSINWAEVKGNVDAAVIRLGYRGYSVGKIAYDTAYRVNRKACEDLGIPFSLYFFPCSVCDLEAEEEADFIIKEASGMNFVLPVFLDSEVAEVKRGSGRADKLSKAERTRYLRIICEKLQSVGIPVGIYASKSWFSDHLDMTQLPYSIWVAQWADKLTYTGPYVLWQHTDAGSVPGISGRVDISRGGTQNWKDLQVPAQHVYPVQKKVTANVLNIRKEPTASSADLGDLIKGSVVTIDREENGFGHIEGWISMKYVK